MRRFPLLALLTAACYTVAAHAADDAATPKSSAARDALKARIAAEEAKGKNAPRPAPAPSAAASKASPAAAASTAPTATAAKDGTPAPAANAATPGATETASKGDATDPTLLPQINVKRDPIEIKEQYDRIYEQEKQILVEKRNTKPTEADKALNDPRVSKALAIFGGESSDRRANIAKERVSLMEDEKDLREALVLAKTPEEKKEIQKQIDELRALRRDLEKSLR